MHRSAFRGRYRATISGAGRVGPLSAGHWGPLSTIAASSSVQRDERSECSRSPADAEPPPDRYAEAQQTRGRGPRPRQGGIACWGRGRTCRLPGARELIPATLPGTARSRCRVG
jgi:hypothetical protein